MVYRSLHGHHRLTLTTLIQCTFYTGIDTALHFNIRQLLGQILYFGFTSHNRICVGVTGHDHSTGVLSRNCTLWLCVDPSGHAKLVDVCGDAPLDSRGPRGRECVCVTQKWPELKEVAENDSFCFGSVPEELMMMTLHLFLLFFFHAPLHLVSIVYLPFLHLIPFL